MHGGQPVCRSSQDLRWEPPSETSLLLLVDPRTLSHTDRGSTKSLGQCTKAPATPKLSVDLWSTKSSASLNFGERESVRGRGAWWGTCRRRQPWSCHACRSEPVYSMRAADDQETARLHLARQRIIGRMVCVN